MWRANGLGISRAAPIDRYECKRKSPFKMPPILGPRSGVGWNAVLGRESCSRALHLRLLYSHQAL